LNFERKRELHIFLGAKNPNTACQIARCQKHFSLRIAIAIRRFFEKIQRKYLSRFCVQLKPGILIGLIDMVHF
jgi:hypothetical protein